MASATNVTEVQRLPWVYKLLLKIHQEICTGGQTHIQINFWRECFQETEVS